MTDSRKNNAPAFGSVPMKSVKESVQIFIPTDIELGIPNLISNGRRIAHFSAGL